MQSRAFIRLQAADSKARPHEWENMAEEKTGGLTAEQENPVDNQQATRAELQARLEQQIAIARRASLAAADAEARCRTLEAEKIQAEEKIQGLEQEVGLFKAELRNAISFLEQRAAETEQKSPSAQESPAPPETERLLPQEFRTRVYSDGRRYLGEVKGDLPEGLGIMAFPDGGYYAGEWREGKRNGLGTLTLPDAQKYTGEWASDLFHGRGMDVYPDGKTYEGEFKEGRYEGQGTLTLADGTRYTGKFAKGLSCGRGILRYPNGDRYEGEFRNNKYHGEGTLTLIDGRTYTGEMEEGLPHGHGIMTFPDGRRYTGEFKSGRFVKKKDLLHRER